MTETTTAAKTPAEILNPEAIADRLVASNPVISPDGAAVAFAAEPASNKEEHGKRALWIVTRDQPARQLTSGDWDDGTPAWSPDSTRLALVSDRVKRGEESGLYILTLAGGEAIRLGEIEGSLRHPAWSPDGATIAVLRTDPKSDADKKKKKDRDDAIEVDADPKFNRLWLVDVATGKARNITTADREVRSFRWTPDGSGLLVVTTELPTVDSSIEGGDVWFAPVHGGLSRKIAHFPQQPSDPVLVEVNGEQRVIAICDGGRAYPPSTVWSVPFSGGEPENLLPDWPGTVYHVAPLGAGGTRVVLVAVQGIHNGVLSLDLSNGQTAPLLSPEWTGKGSIDGDASWSADGKRVAFVWSDASTPEELYWGDVAGKIVKATDFGKDFASALQPGEEVHWTSDDGVEVQGVLIYPAGYEAGKKYPLIVEIHGGPSWQWEDRAMLNWHDWAQMLAANGYAVLLPNPRGSTGRGAEFERLLQDDIGGGEYRDIAAGARAMVDRGIADPERLGVGGWSWGGYMTARVVTETTMFKAAVMGAGLCNLISDHGTDDIPSANLLYFSGHPYDDFDAYWNASPLKNIKRATTPTLIVHGDADDRVPPSQGAEFYRALKVNKVPTTFVRYPREGHPIVERLHQIDLMHRILDWYGQYLGPARKQNP